MVGRDAGAALESGEAVSTTSPDASGAEAGATAALLLLLLGLVGVVGVVGAEEEEEEAMRRRSMPWQVTMWESEGGQMSGWMM